MEENFKAAVEKSRSLGCIFG